MIESELATDRANRTALLLTFERYNKQLAPFVKGSSARLEYVRSEIDTILDEVCSSVEADRDYVSSRLEDHISSAVLTKDPATREKLKVKQDWVKNVKKTPATGDIKKDKVDPNDGEVSGLGDAEARKPDANVDLNKDTQKGTKPSERKEGNDYRDYPDESVGDVIAAYRDGTIVLDDGITTYNPARAKAFVEAGGKYQEDIREQQALRASCFRCGNDLHEKVASITSVCDSCTKELKEKSSTCEGECEGDCKCGEKEAAIKTAETFTYELGPAGIHMQSVAETAQQGLTFSMLTEPVGDLEPMSLTFPGDSPMQLMRWLIAFRKAGLPVEGSTVQLTTDTPEEVVAILDRAGRKGGGGRPEANVKEADLYNQDYSIDPPPSTFDDLVTPANKGNMPYVCELCNKTFPSEEEALQHRNTEHADELAQKQQEMNNAPNLTPGTVPGAQYGSKEAAPADVPEQADVSPLPQTPGDNFDDMVQDLANRAAAIQFSSLDDNDLNNLAESLGLTKEDIQGQLQVVAIFDNYVGVNGELTTSAPEVPEGYTEVQSKIRATAHEALVPTNIVISKVAESMGMEQDLAYQMVKDKYGGVDLPDKYHASVQGTYHFYLPEQLAGNATQDVAAEQGDIGPTTQAPSGQAIPEAQAPVR